MEKTINQRNPVEYELDIKVQAEELAPEIEGALRAYRTKVTLKGFRPGKVPIPLLKKMYGKVVAFEVVEKLIQGTFEDEVMFSDEYDVLGQPHIAVLEYEPDQDLHAVVRFGVKPEFELADFSGETVTRFVHEVDEDEIEAELERLRYNEGELVASEEEVGDEDVVVVDVQSLDEATDTPIIGRRTEDVQIFMKDPNLRDEFKRALQGRRAGDAVKVEVPVESEDEEEEPQSALLHLPGAEEKRQKSAEMQRLRLEVKEVKRWNLPELDDAFAKRVTEEQVSSVEALREGLTEQLSESWSRRFQELLESKVIERVIELHDFHVPEAFVAVQQDNLLNDYKQRHKDSLPEDFDEQVFREETRGQAAKMAKWVLIQDKIIDQEGVEVTEDDLAGYLQNFVSGPGIEPAQLIQYFRRSGMLEAVQQRIVLEKVMQWLIDRFNVVEKSRADLEQQAEQRREARAEAEDEPAAPAEGAVASAESGEPDAPAEEEDSSAEHETGSPEKAQQ